MKLVINIRRYDPHTDADARDQTYEVEAQPTDRILDVLMHIKRFQDGTLGFRKSCAHGVCGSDAMRINGKDGLACKTLVRDVAENDGDTITVEPLANFPVLRDLIVDQSTFFQKYRSVRPFLINDEAVVEKERIQSQEDRLVFDDTTNCILCASCYSACPVLGENEAFLGPAAIVQAFRFNEDTRDQGFEQRLAALDDPDGVWPCQNHFQCTKCCPREILITKRINQTKKRIQKYREEG